MKYIRWTVLILCVCMTMTSGCSRETRQPMERQTASQYTVRDSRGKIVSFSEKPQRIVSCFVFADEIILDLVDHKRIAGLSKWVHDPGLSSSIEQAKDVPGIAELNMESIISLSPDVVILADNVGADFVASLEDAGLTVYVFRGIFRIHEVAPLVVELAKVVGEPARGEALVQQMKARLASLAEKTASISPEQRTSALIFLRFGAIGGAGSIYNDSLTAIGLRDSYTQVRQIIMPDTSMMLSKEEVVKANPEWLIMGSWTMGGKYKNSDKQLADFYDDPAYATVEAIKNRRAIIVPQRYVNCLSHHVGEVLEELYPAIYLK